MPISAFCPSCGTRVKVPDNLAGRSAKCPRCAASIPIPVASVVPPMTEPAKAPRSRGTCCLDTCLILLFFGFLFFIFCIF